VPDVELVENRRLADGLVTLTHAARLGGPAQLVATLATLVDGWAVVVDRDGGHRLGTGGAHVHLDDAVAVAGGRRRRVRHAGLLVTPIGDGGPRSSQLVVAVRPGQESHTRALAAQAAVLLDLVDRPAASTDATRQARMQAVDMLLLGRDVVVQRLAAAWGLGAGETVVVRLRSRSRAVSLERVALQWLADLDLPELLAADGAVVTAVLPSDAVPQWVTRVDRAVEDDLVPVRCGVGTAVPVAQLAVSAEQATQALEVAVADGRPVAAYADLATTRLLLGGPASAALAGRALAGIDASGPQAPQLLESLRVFLAEVGSWEAAAAQLGVHRHTLRHRIARVEALTGRDLSRMEDRVELWVALRARGQGGQ